MQGVNLIPAARRSAAARTRKRQHWSLVVGGYAAVVLVVTLVLRMAGAGAQQAIAAESQAAAETIARCRGEIAAARTDFKRLFAEAQANSIIHGQPDWSILLELIASSAGGDVILRSVRLSAATDAPDQREAPDRFLLSMAGLGQGQTAVSAFVLRLEASGLLDEVKLLQSRREPFLDGEAVAFDVECWLAAAPRGGKEAGS